MSAKTAPKGNMSITAAADRLGVHPRTVRRYIAEGRLAAYRIGPRLIRIERESLEKLGQPLGGGST